MRGSRYPLDIRQAIVNYQPYNEQERMDKEQLLEYIDTYDNLYTRENETAHFTASAWVVNKDRTKVLMAFHDIYQSWSWLGGHVDGETDFLEVAIKEVKEESGVENVRPVNEEIYGIEVLPVPSHMKNGEPIAYHHHLNITYLLEADEDETVQIKEDENSAVGWLTLEEAVTMPSEPEMILVYQKLNEKL